MSGWFIEIWQINCSPFEFGKPDDKYNWKYHFDLGSEDLGPSYGPQTERKVIGTHFTIFINIFHFWRTRIDI